MLLYVLSSFYFIQNISLLNCSASIFIKTIFVCRIYIKKIFIFLLFALYCNIVNCFIYIHDHEIYILIFSDVLRFVTFQDSVFLI